MAKNNYTQLESNTLDQLYQLRRIEMKIQQLCAIIFENQKFQKTNYDQNDLFDQVKIIVGQMTKFGLSKADQNLFLNAFNTFPKTNITQTQTNQTIEIFDGKKFVEYVCRYFYDREIDTKDMFNLYFFNGPTTIKHLRQKCYHANRNTEKYSYERQFSKLFVKLTMEIHNYHKRIIDQYLNQQKTAPSGAWVNEMRNYMLISTQERNAINNRIPNTVIDRTKLTN